MPRLMAMSRLGTLGKLGIFGNFGNARPMPMEMPGSPSAGGKFAEKLHLELIQITVNRVR